MDRTLQGAIPDSLSQIIRGSRVCCLLMAVVLVGIPHRLAAQVVPSGSPLEEVARDMKVAANHLSKRTTDKPAQTAQTDALSKLDRLIAELEKEREQVRGSMATARPARPVEQSQVRQGPGGEGDMHGPREKGDRWGELPPHERDRILQSLTEGFPPHYQSILEAYYKRLAVEKPFDDANSPASAAGTKKSRIAKPAVLEPTVPAEKVSK